MTVLVSDSFNRADNTTSLGSTDSYNGGTSVPWQVLSGTGSIKSNQAYFTASSMAVVNGNSSDAKVTVTIATAGTEADIYCRVTDANNWYRIACTSTTVYLQKMVSGTKSTIATYSYAVKNGDIVDLQTNSSTLTVFVNGTSVITASDTSLTSGTMQGIGNYGTSPYFDNFEVDSVGSSGTTYIGSGTFQGTSSVTSNETLILSPRTYAGNGVSTGISSLTTNEKLVESVGGNSNGLSNLTTTDHVSNSSPGGLNQGVPNSDTITGTSSLTTSETKSYSANGNVNGISSLTTSESFIGHSTTTYSASGSVNSKANVSSVGNVIYVDFGNSNGQSNLTTSEQLVSHTGTTYSESGQSSGLSSVSSNNKITFESTVSAIGQSTLTTTEHESLSAQGNVQGQSSTTSTEQFVGHATTTYTAMVSSDGTSNVSSSETKSYVASGVVNGMADSTSSHDNVVYFPSGTANGYTTINTNERYISVFEVVGIIELNGQIQLELQFVGVIDLNLYLKGVV